MSGAPLPPGAVGAVAIGRNEGARLDACLSALRTDPAVGPVVYVDSGSTDGSQTRAVAAGAEVVVLDMEVPFTAARARNAGLAALRARTPRPDFVQFVDGDCALQDGWVETALAEMARRPKAAVVCGRRRERRPDASVYNRMCDLEWDTPIGQAQACGGDALMRIAALDAVDGFDPSLIAGEEPELCVRLRAEGWEIRRVDAEMTLHDAAMDRFGQFWRRARRAGHAYAEGAALHGAPPERHYVAETRRALVWGAGIPLTVLLLLPLLGSWALAGLLVYPLQILRLALRDRDRGRFAWIRAALLTVGKAAEAIGVLEYGANRLRRRRTALIEYK